MLVSFVLTSPADPLLRDAVAETLRAEPAARAALFEQRLREIEAFMQSRPDEMPFKFWAFTGTDGSRIFRGRAGQSIVIDSAGALWRARSYEDFDTTYTITESGCSIDTLTPHESEVQDRDGHWYSLRIRPYVTLENKIDGASVVLLDIDTLKKALEQLRQALG